MGARLARWRVYAIPGLSLGPLGICRDEDQILQITERFSQLAAEESRDHAGIVGRLLEEKFGATEHHLAGIGGRSALLRLDRWDPQERR